VDDGDTLAVALAGFEHAHERHRQIYGVGTPEEVFIPTAECVYWAAVIDEQLRMWPGYEAALASLSGAELLPGIRYARNLKTHQLPLTLRRNEGLTFPITFPLTFSEVIWLAADELPDPDRQTKHTPAQRVAYDQHLAKHPTRHTLDALSKLFTAIQEEPGCPLRRQSSIRGVEAENYRAFKYAQVALPSRGLVFVAGANNSGKSALLSTLDVVAGRNDAPAVRHGGASSPARVTATFELDDQERLTVLANTPSSAALLSGGALSKVALVFEERHAQGPRLVEVRAAWPDKGTLTLADVTGASSAVDARAVTALRGQCCTHSCEVSEPDHTFPKFRRTGPVLIPTRRTSTPRGSRHVRLCDQPSQQIELFVSRSARRPAAR
jgi:hypothetical protein